MARFGRFNPRQKRDKNGKWTKGGGSSSRSKAAKSLNKRGRLSNGALLITTKDPNKYSKRGSKIGGLVGIALGAPAGLPLAGGGVGLLAGSIVGNAIDQRVSKRRIKAAEAALRRSRKG